MLVSSFPFALYRHKLEVETEDKKSLDMTIVELRAKINSVEEEMSRYAGVQYGPMCYGTVCCVEVLWSG